MLFLMTCIYQVQVHALSKDFCRSRFYRVWIGVLCVLYRWRYHTQLCPDDRTRGQKLAGIMCLHLRMGSRGSSTDTRRSRHTSLALAGGSDVNYVPSVNWYIFVSTTTRSWKNVKKNIDNRRQNNLTDNTCTCRSRSSTTANGSRLMCLTQVCTYNFS